MATNAQPQLFPEPSSDKAGAARSDPRREALFAKQVAACISDDLLRRLAFAGTPGEVADQARALIDAGATRIEFGTPHGLSEAEGLRLLGEGVLPALEGSRQ